MNSTKTNEQRVTVKSSQDTYEQDEEFVERDNETEDALNPDEDTHEEDSEEDGADIVLSVEDELKLMIVHSNLVSIEAAELHNEMEGLITRSFLVQVAMDLVRLALFFQFFKRSTLIFYVNDMNSG